MCEACKGLGWVLMTKPMTGLDGKLHMVSVPQPCAMCDANFRSLGLKERPMTVTQENAKQEIERRMSELADLLALFVDAPIDPRAWRQLLTYANLESKQ